MVLRLFPLLVLALLMAGAASTATAEGQIFTLWPLIDYRHSDEVDYTSVNLLGPLISFERKGSEEEYGIRPFLYHARDPVEDISYSEYLYPVASRKSEPERSFSQVFHLLNIDRSEREESESMLFPLVFSGHSEERGSYFAIFPLGGKIYDKFGRDEIRFTLFPLYGRTEKKDRVIRNYLWPVFASIEGENESGFKVWPLYGASQKEGVYRKRFFLWPIFFKEDLNLDTPNPRHRRAAFPFYVEDESPHISSQTWLWPFFSHVENRQRDYEEWNYPWPLLRTTRGSDREGIRVLPLFSDERLGATRKRWYLWPIYKIEEIHTESLDRRRDRVLYFLYSDLEEKLEDETEPRLRRVALWPLFTYQRVRGVSHFHTLSVLEPFFPGREGIERNWAPLWRLYQRKWDGQGNEISSFLWNLYWKERRGEDFAVELFPLFFYRRETDAGSELSLLKGFFRLRSGAQGRRIHLLYLPWGIPVGGPTPEDY